MRKVIRNGVPAEIRAVIFDMDGVIFDSERGVYECWKELERKYGFGNVDEPYKKSIGVSWAQTKENMLEHYGPDFPYDVYRQEQSRMYHERFDNGRLPMKPGIRELLEFLKEKGLKTAVASSTRQEVVRNQIRDAHLLSFFDELISGDMVTHSKPDPEIFLTAAKAIGVSPENCVVIEDAFSGIRAAFAAGMIPLMVPDLLEPDDEMRDKAEAVLPDLLAVKDWLASDEDLTEEGPKNNG